jgi:uncharacterized protein YqhQ
MTLSAFLRLATHTQLLPLLESGEETLVGGQAVMEGVMMRTPHAYCTSVRRPDGEIVTEQGPLAKVSEKYPLFKLPVLRGVGVLGQAMWLGVRSLQFSTHVAVDAEQKDLPVEERKKIPGWLMGLNLAFSFVFFFALYKYLPLLLTERLSLVYPDLKGRILFNLVDGLIRLFILLAFMFLLSRARDIHRVFEFHGGEHRVVFNFESGQPLSVENAQRFVTWHPRCGTSFLIVVMLISIPIYTVLPWDGFAAKLAARLVLLPLITGVSYEVIRFAAKRRTSLLALMTTPGLWLQRITTQPPADDQTAVALHALQQAMELEKQHGGDLVIA